jgi:hypothetical protein
MNGLPEVQTSEDVQSVNLSTSIEKECPKCKKTKPLNDFYARYRFCKECIKSESKKWCNENPEKYLLWQRNYRVINREKIKLNQKRWADNNRQKRRDANRIWGLKTREQRNIKLKEWRKNNPEKDKESRKRAHKKMILNPNYKLSASMSCNIGRYLKGIKSGRHWEDLIGYTNIKLKQHLEKQFTTEMTWENYGTVWVVDHKIPKSVFNYEKPEDIDFKKCWALPNLQPLEKIENIKKSNKLSKPFQPSLTI